ncbi:MAG TPA: hypothetical protein VJO33_15160 [Gemmatimonadaceae bacterium]|nr:hypothetical protein [Gemmatimonadaceae bacterium]
MRFVWPRDRYDSLTREALVVAATLTTCAGVAISLPMVRAYRTSHTPSAPFESVEVISLTAPVRQPATIVRASRIGHATSSSRVALPDESSLTGDSTSLAVRDTGFTAAIDTTAPRATSANSPTASALGPVIAPSAFSKSVNISEAQSDSIAKRQAEYVAMLFRTFRQTTEQRDSAGRERARLAAVAREEHRPMAILLGGASLPLPFLGRVPSRAQRARDSAVHADNLERLARLAERARLKRDSILAHTLAGVGKNATDSRVDTLTRLPRRDPQPND